MSYASVSASSFFQRYYPAHRVRFTGDEESGRKKRKIESTASDSDASSIHTDPEQQQIAANVYATLDAIKDKISPEQYAVLNRGANFVQKEIERLKRTGRQWQNKFEQKNSETFQQLQYLAHQLRESRARYQIIEDECTSLKEQNAKLERDKNLLQKKYEEQTPYVHTQRQKIEELELLLKEQETLTNSIAQLEKEATEIKDMLIAKGADPERLNALIKGIDSVQLDFMA